jgi:hypothetical protein
MTVLMALRRVGGTNGAVSDLYAIKPRAVVISQEVRVRLTFGQSVDRCDHRFLIFELRCQAQVNVTSRHRNVDLSQSGIHATNHRIDVPAERAALHHGIL